MSLQLTFVLERESSRIVNVVKYRFYVKVNEKEEQSKLEWAYINDYDDRRIEKHPVLLEKIDPKSIKRKKTVNVSLSLEQSKTYVKNGRFFFNEKELATVKSISKSFNAKVRLARQKLNKMTFDSKVNSALVFIQEFEEVLKELEPKSFSYCSELLNFFEPEKRIELASKNLDKDELVLEFLKYENIYSGEKSKCISTKVEDCNSYAEFFKIKRMYFEKFEKEISLIKN